MMNEVIMAFGENAAMIVTGCLLLVVAVLCALIVHDAWARREQLVRMREEDERQRQRAKYLRELVRQDRAQRRSEFAAIQAIESIKQYPEMNDIEALKKAGWL